MFKDVKWGHMAIILVVVVIGAVIAQLLVKEETGTDGKVKRTLSMGSEKKTA